MHNCDDDDDNNTSVTRANRFRSPVLCVLWCIFFVPKFAIASEKERDIISISRHPLWFYDIFIANLIFVFGVFFTIILSSSIVTHRNARENISPLYGFHIRYNWNRMQIWVKSYYRSVCCKWPNALCLRGNSTKTVPCISDWKSIFYPFRARNSFDFNASNAPTVHRHTSHTHTHIFLSFLLCTLSVHSSGFYSQLVAI